MKIIGLIVFLIAAIEFFIMDVSFLSDTHASGIYIPPRPPIKTAEIAKCDDTGKSTDKDCKDKI